MKIAIFGTGYVGLITGVCLAEIGNEVTCIDINEKKISDLENGLSPFYETGLSQLLIKNNKSRNLHFTANSEEVINLVDVIYIAVGTPANEDGSTDLRYIEEVVNKIIPNIKKNTIVVIKSTVPIGTNKYIKQLFDLNTNFNISVVSNPEFLREGSAIHDSFYGDRIVIGTLDEKTFEVLENINKPFGIPIINTSPESAEMIKYSSNAFLATKISFINEIANLCGKVNADIEEVALGMGLDNRIGNSFLKAGIGYGGSCFPKDCSSLLHFAGTKDYKFKILKSVIEVNESQKISLVNIAKEKIREFNGVKIAILGLSFKPNTDDMRNAVSVTIVKELITLGARITVYDPVATENAKKVLPKEVLFMESIDEAIRGAKIAFIITEWNEIIEYPLSNFEELMESPIVFDGRNCYSIDEIKKYNIDYYSLGRETVMGTREKVR